MKLEAFTILFICALSVNAQSWKEKIFNNKNQFEFGITRTSYPDSKFDDHGNSNGINNYSSYRYYINANYFIGYTRTIGKNYTISLDVMRGSTSNSRTSATSAIGEILYARYNLFNVGFGKQINLKKLQLHPKIYLSYRYDGYQYTVFGFRDPLGILTEPLFADLQYNSVGGAVGLDINYFFAKHIGLGVKTSYNLYPFEKAKLSAGQSIDQPDPLLVATHRPLNQMIVLNFKIIARL
ncbi:MAG: hypothetical protein EAY81_09610 [Bacteroidetes bacterium]|nr:MAG: hypothetical protein EAY81_09610 [Bacteroidota bacterium]